MFVCPRCGESLTAVRKEGTVFWSCGQCDGRALTIELLHHSVEQRMVQDLLRHARDEQRASTLRCPACARRMLTSTIALGENELELDLCLPCHFVWFDAGERERLPAPALAPPVPAPNPRPKSEAEVQFVVDHVRELTRADGQEGSQWNGWEWLPGVLGQPADLEGPDWRHRPWITWSFMAIVFVSSPWWIRLFADMQNSGWPVSSRYAAKWIVMQLGFVLYALWLFGRGAESVLGPLRTIALASIATLLAVGAESLVNRDLRPASTAVSTGITALAVCFVCALPRIRFAFPLPTIGRSSYSGWTSRMRPSEWLPMSARTALIGWLAVQLVPVFWRPMAGIIVSQAVAALTAVGFWFLIHRRPTRA